MAGEEITIPIALMHTGVAMGTVFAVLILISFVIYLLKFVPKFFEKNEERQALKEAKKKEKSSKGNAGSKMLAEAPVRKADAPTAAPAPKKSTDAELVAVIAAAIAATMTEETGVYVPADGLVIRSIRKRGFA